MNFIIVSAFLIFFKYIFLYSQSIIKLLDFIPQQQNENYISRFYSTIHSIILSIILTLYFINEQMAIIAFNFTIAYCIFDLYCIIRYNSLTIETPFGIYIHHIALIFILVNVYDKSIFYFSTVVGLYSEFSTIFMNLSWLIHKIKLKHIKIKIVIYFCLLSSWFVTRVLNFTFLLFYVIIVFDQVPFYPYLAFICIWIFNIYWFSKLVNKFKDEYNSFYLEKS